MGRLSSFLSASDISSTNYERYHKPEEDECIVEIEKASFIWGPDELKTAEQLEKEKKETIAANSYRLSFFVLIIANLRNRMRKAHKTQTQK